MSEKPSAGLAYQLCSPILCYPRLVWKRGSVYAFVRICEQLSRVCGKTRLLRMKRCWKLISFRGRIDVGVGRVRFAS